MSSVSVTFLGPTGWLGHNVGYQSRDSTHENKSILSSFKLQQDYEGKSYVHLLDVYTNRSISLFAALSQIAIIGTSEWNCYMYAVLLFLLHTNLNFSLTINARLYSHEVDQKVGNLAVTNIPLKLMALTTCRSRPNCFLCSSSEQDVAKFSTSISTSSFSRSFRCCSTRGGWAASDGLALFFVLPFNLCLFKLDLQFFYITLCLA